MANKLTQSLLFVLFFFLTSSASANATNYYVDNSCTVNGNGLGTTCASSTGSTGPFNTLASAQSKITGNQSDNQLLLKKGQTYSGQYTVNAYGTKDHPFTISSYGTGNKPIISGGKDNIMVSCTNCQYIVIDGLELSHPDRYGIILVYPAANITIRNLFVHHTPGSGVVLYGSGNNIIDHNEISWCSSHGITVKVGDPPYHPTTGNIISHNQTHHNFGYGIVTGGAPYGGSKLDGIKIFDNESFHNSTGIYLVHTNHAEVYQNNLHDNGKDCQGSNDCTGEPYGFAIQSGSYNEFHDNLIARSASVGIGVYGDQKSSNENSDENKFYRNIIYGTYPKQWPIARDINWQCYPGNSVGRNNQIFNNLIVGNGHNFLIGDSNPSISGNIAYNNLFYGAISSIDFESTSPNAGWTFKNNIFANNKDYAIDASRRSGGLTLANNLYYKPVGGTLVRYGSNSYSSSTLSSLDPHAIIANPRFAGTNNWYDFRLLPDSPAIDSGINLDSDFNLALDPTDNSWPINPVDQNNFGTGWEIGPFIYSNTNPATKPGLPTGALAKVGDANNDRKVDGVDYSIWLTNYNLSKSGPSFGDFNNSGTVDGVDYVVWLNNYSY